MELTAQLYTVYKHIIHAFNAVVLRSLPSPPLPPQSFLRMQPSKPASPGEPWIIVGSIIRTNYIPKGFAPETWPSRQSLDRAVVKFGKLRAKGESIPVLVSHGEDEAATGETLRLGRTKIGEVLTMYTKTTNGATALMVEVLIYPQFVHVLTKRGNFSPQFFMPTRRPGDKFQKIELWEVSVVMVPGLGHNVWWTKNVNAPPAPIVGGVTVAACAMMATPSIGAPLEDALRPGIILMCTGDVWSLSPGTQRGVGLSGVVNNGSPVRPTPPSPPHLLFKLHICTTATRLFVNPHLCYGCGACVHICDLQTHTTQARWLTATRSVMGPRRVLTPETAKRHLVARWL